MPFDLVEYRRGRERSNAHRPLTHSLDLSKEGLAVNATHSHPEEWRAIPGYRGIYEVSDRGRIRSLGRVVPRKDGASRWQEGRILRPRMGGSGYPHVDLWQNNRRTNRTIHSIVLEAFVGPRPSKSHEACHNDGDRTNARIDNLRWDTRTANAADKRRHGTDHNVAKSHCPRGHMLIAPNLIRSSLARGSRDCLSCNKARAYIRHHKLPKSDLQAVSDKFYVERFAA